MAIGAGIASKDAACSAASSVDIVRKGTKNSRCPISIASRREQKRYRPLIEALLSLKTCSVSRTKGGSE